MAPLADGWPLFKATSTSIFVVQGKPQLMLFKENAARHVGVTWIELPVPCFQSSQASSCLSERGWMGRKTPAIGFATYFRAQPYLASCQSGRQANTFPLGSGGRSGNKQHESDRRHVTPKLGPVPGSPPPFRSVWWC